MNVELVHLQTIVSDSKIIPSQGQTLENGNNRRFDFSFDIRASQDYTNHEVQVRMKVFIFHPNEKLELTAKSLFWVCYQIPYKFAENMYTTENTRLLAAIGKQTVLEVNKVFDNATGNSKVFSGVLSVSDDEMLHFTREAMLARLN